MSQCNGLKEFESLYQNIDLGIIVTNNGAVEYSNDFFKKFMKNLDANIEDCSKILNMKSFNCIRRKTSISIDNSFDNSEDPLFSLNDLI